jgi:integrase
MRTDWVHTETIKHILAALTPENRLAMETSLSTGLRIDDVLSLRTQDLLKERFTIHEMKTGKARRLRLPQRLRDDLFRQAGRFFVFEHRLDPRKHRTRQAVWKDMKRAAVAFRVNQKFNVAPHTARKIYAVSQYQKSQNLHKVQELLNHRDEAVTMLYAMADQITENATRNR